MNQKLLSFASIALLVLLSFSFISCDSNQQKVEELQNELTTVKEQLERYQSKVDSVEVLEKKALEFSREAGPITLSLATTWAENYQREIRNANSPHRLFPMDFCGQNSDEPIVSFHIEAEALRHFIGSTSNGNLGMDGIRFYIGQDNTGTKKRHTLLLIGTKLSNKGGIVCPDTNEDGRYYSEQPQLGIYEFVQPCPTFCNYTLSGVETDGFGKPQ